MKKSTKPEWLKTSVEGLYEYRPKGLADSARGIYYSRYSLNGDRTFRSHETSVFEQGKIKHLKLMGDVEKDRQRGGDTESRKNFKTLGALFEETKLRLAETSKKTATVNSREDMTSRLKTNWQEGVFDTFLARNVTAKVVRELRDHLLEHAKWEVVVKGHVMRTGDRDRGASVTSRLT